MMQAAPLQFDIQFETTEGDFILHVPTHWSPIGATRLFNLVQNSFFTDAHFYRVVEGFVAQFGSSGNPAVDRVYREPASFLANDHAYPGASNLRGTVAFGAEYDGDEMAVNRSTELYINLADNQRLDSVSPVICFRSCSSFLPRAHQNNGTSWFV